MGRNILPERKVELYHTKLDNFKAELERRNFHKRLTNLADESIDLALVKEFYANLYSSEDRPPKQSRVRGHLVKIDADNLKRIPGDTCGICDTLYPTHICTNNKTNN